MFNPGDRVIVTVDGPYSGREFVVSSDRNSLSEFTNVNLPENDTPFAQYTFLNAFPELVSQPVSLRCEYCDDHSHLTVECPGLRHGNPIAEAFKAKHFPPPKLVCSACGQPSHPGRKMFCPGDVLLCGDCVAGGTPLTPSPVVEPLTAADCCAWQTACDEGAG